MGPDGPIRSASVPIRRVLALMRRTALLLPLMLLPLSLGQSASAHPGASATIEHYSHEIEDDPKNQRLYILRGIAYSNDALYDEALADLKQAEKLGDPVLASCDLGVLHYRKGELDAALGYFDRYLERYPARGRGYCLEYRARARRDSGDHAGSIRDFRRVIELEPRPNPGHYISVATMLTESGESGIDEALAILDAGIAKLGLNPQLQHHAIELELTSQRPDRAQWGKGAGRPDAEGCEGAGQTASQDTRSAAAPGTDHDARAPERARERTTIMRSIQARGVSAIAPRRLTLGVATREASACGVFAIRPPDCAGAGDRRQSIARHHRDVHAYTR